MQSFCHRQLSYQCYTMPRSPRSVHKILIQPQSIPHRPPSKVSRFQKQKMCWVHCTVHKDWSTGALGCQFVGARYGSNKNQGWGLKYKHGCQQFRQIEQELFMFRWVPHPTFFFSLRPQSVTTQSLWTTTIISLQLKRLIWQKVLKMRLIRNQAIYCET